VCDAACAATFDVIRKSFERQHQTMGLALSLEVAGVSEAGTLKHNSLHSRLRGK
jgi:5-carboxymethyl-2-hydroxymuconate isomerase